MARTKILYAETYRAPGMRIKGQFLPTLPSATEGFEVKAAFLMKAGRILDSGGQEYEFQDVRIYLGDRK